MSQTNRIRSHLGNNGSIFFMVFFIQCISAFGTVLMAAHSVQFQMFPVQEETFFRIYMIKAQAQRLSYLIYFLSVSQQCHFRTIHERIFPPIPQMRIFNRKFQSCGMYLIRIYSQIYILLLHNLVSIPDFHIHLYRFCRRRTV